MGHQTFSDHQSGTGSQLSFSITYGGIHALDLHHLHLHRGILLHIDFCARIQDTFACAVTLTVVLFHIFYFCVFSHVETVNTVMLGILHTAVMNTTAGHYHYIGILTDIEIVVYHLFQTALTQNHRDVYAFVFCARFDLNIDTAAVILGNNIDICRCISGCHFAVGTDIVCALRHCMKVCYLLKYSLLNLIYHSWLPPFSSLSQLLTADAVPKSSGRISSFGPCLEIVPFAITTISSAISRILS